ncbi:MAG: DUF3256 family protein [Bacteroidales bacterium]
MKTTLFVLSLIFFASGLSSQSVAVYFEIIPEQHLLQIETNRRKDMLDMKKAGQKAEVPTRLGGTAEMTDLTNDYLQIRTSPNSTFEMKLIPLQQDQEVIALIKTTCAPVCDSEISFYTTTWEPLATEKYIDLPTRYSFVKDSVDRDDDAFRQAIESIDMNLIRLRFGDKPDTVVATNGYEQYLPDYIYKELRPFLNNEVIITLKSQPASK